MHYYHYIILILFITHLHLTNEEEIPTVMMFTKTEYNKSHPNIPIISTSERIYGSYWNDETTTNRRRLATISNPLSQTDKLNMLLYINGLRAETAKGTSPTKNPTTPA
eukprot:180620_1